MNNFYFINTSPSTENYVIKANTEMRQQHNTQNLSDFNQILSYFKGVRKKKTTLDVKLHKVKPLLNAVQLHILLLFVLFVQ